jgi:hypothetical protein
LGSRNPSEPGVGALDGRRKILWKDPQALEGPCWSGGDVIRCLLPTITTLYIGLFCPLVNPVYLERRRGEDPAVHGEIGAGDETGARGSEEKAGFGDLLRAAEPTAT